MINDNSSLVLINLSPCEADFALLTKPDDMTFST